MIVLTAKQISLFKNVLLRLSPQERGFVEATSVRAGLAAARAAGHRQYGRPADQVTKVIGERVSADVCRGLVAVWALELPERVEAEALPTAVLELYPFWLDQLAEWLSRETGPYDADYWAKDVRFALGLSVPGSRTQTLDLVAYCRPGQIVRDALKRRNPDVLLRYVSIGGWHTNWLETHTESRHTQDFTEAGWDRLWASAAALCRSRPSLAGVIGSSWFFDPPLESISPRLTYLRANPTAHGAFTVDQGPGQTHSDRASATSPTRRAMIAAGKYVPHSWLLAWPRASLIEWAYRKYRAVIQPDRRRPTLADGRRSGVASRRTMSRGTDRRVISERRVRSGD